MKLQRLTSVLYLFLFGIFSAPVLAVNVPTMITSTIKDVFSFIPEPYLIRFFYFILLFALFSFVVKKIFKEGSTAYIIALVISLMSSLLLPDAFLRIIFVNYSFIGAILLLLAPIFFLYYLKNLLPGDGAFPRLMKAAIMLLIAFFFFKLAAADTFNIELSKWLNIKNIAFIGAIVFIIAAFVEIFKAFGSGSGAGFGWLSRRGSSGGGGSGGSRRSKVRTPGISGSTADTNPDELEELEEKLDTEIDRDESAEKAEKRKIEDIERTEQADEDKLIWRYQKLLNDLNAYRKAPSTGLLTEIRKFMDETVHDEKEIEELMKQRDAYIRDLTAKYVSSKDTLAEIKSDEEKMIALEKYTKAIMASLYKLFSTDKSINKEELFNSTVKLVNYAIPLAKMLRSAEKKVEKSVEHTS
jgi:uncharacterized membrane protein YgcG